MSSRMSPSRALRASMKSSAQSASGSGVLQPTPLARISYKWLLVQPMAAWMVRCRPVEPDIEWHFDAAQDHGLDVVESDLEAGDGGGTHAATLRRSSLADQFHG